MILVVVRLIYTRMDGENGGATQSSVYFTSKMMQLVTNVTLKLQMVSWRYINSLMHALLL